MKKIAIVLALSCPLAVRAADAKAVTNRVGLNPRQTVRIEMDKGTLSVAPAASDAMTYEVEFVPNQRGLGLFRIFDRNASSPVCEGCSATYNADKGLLIRAGEGFNAIAKVGVPVSQALVMSLSAGKIDIGPLAGKIEASLGAGTLKYDASALPADVCVDASVKSGSARNDRDRDCKLIGVVLRTETGIVSVN